MLILYYIIICSSIKKTVFFRFPAFIHPSVDFLFLDMLY